MAVDNDAIVRAVSGLPLVGNEEGLIPAFGLYLTRHYAPFYNRASFAFLHEAERRSYESAVKARAALVEAGHVCAFNTFGGIMLSQEWEAVVAPMIESKEDWVRGIVGVVNALGWGVWKIEQLEADQRLHISVANTYESEGYVSDYPRRTSGGVCFLASGGVAGIMNLIYHGDIASRPSLDSAYYKSLFQSPNGFRAVETACRATGADRCEFVATRGGE